MNVRIVTQDSHQLAAFNATTFFAQEGRLSSIAQSKKSKPRRPISKEPFSQVHRLDRQNHIAKQAKLHKIHIHHRMSGHGGKHWVEGAAVDGYHPETN